jgi:transposase
MTTEAATNWHEARRYRAYELSEAGWNQRDIAKVLGVSKGAVSRWLASARLNGKKSLAARERHGAPRRLRPQDLWLLPDLLSHGAEAYGFPGAIWTCSRVARVISQEFGVSYDRSHVSRLLKEIGWSPQKPTVRASQRDESNIRYWRECTWPEVKHRARLERRELVFIDESGYYLLPFTARTYAPIGRTPVLKVFLTRDHLSIMSGVSPTGGLFTMIREDALNGDAAVMFLRHVRRCVDRKLLVIWDGSPIHRGKIMQNFLQNGAAKYIHLEALPPYAPDLNPDEGVWRYTKCADLRNICCLDLHELHRHVRGSYERLRRRPSLIKSFFSQAGLTL